jgi:polysaccharide export outer membrane protein
LKKSFFLLIIILFSFHGCSFKKDYTLFNQTSSFESLSSTIIDKKVRFEYKIMPNDRISMTVYQHPDLSTDAQTNTNPERGILVDDDGIISLPLIEDIKVAGLTQKTAAKKIEKAYNKYLKYSKVKLEVINKKAYVIGEVKSPGEISLLNNRMTLIQAIASAKDLTDTANREKIFVIQPSENGITTHMINLTDTNSLHYASMLIRPNDIIYVTPNSMKSVNSDINSITPIFSLISTLLSPFVTIKYLSNN